MLVELKNGDTYNGRLVSCNMFMNLMLQDVICTSRVCGRIVAVHHSLPFPPPPALHSYLSIIIMVMVCSFSNV
jgi:small nuclear ribonucleoprotein (snRNP)-like protein